MEAFKELTLIMTKYEAREKIDVLSTPIIFSL